MELSQGSENASQQSKNKPKHRLLKTIAVIIIALFLATYFLTYIATVQYEKNRKEEFLNTNSAYTGQDITIDTVNYDGAAWKTVIQRLKVYNPPEFVSPYSISIGQTTFTAESQLQGTGKAATVDFTIPAVILKNVNINYDINANGQVNLHLIIDNILKAFNGQPSNTNHAQFKLGDVMIERPTINIYKNRNIIKTIEVPNINIAFDRQKTTTYLEALTNTCLKTIEAIDKAVLK